MGDCRHRWLIATPHGTPLLWGRCWHCHEWRRFPASASARFSFGDASALATAVRRATEANRG